MPQSPSNSEVADRWRKRARRGWALLASAAGVAVAVLWLDQELKRAPHAGFRPDDATITATAASLPGVLAALEYSHMGQALFSAWPDPVAAAERAVRLATGIRPTPRRCHLWLGETALAGMGPSGAGLCVRPGVALHIAHLLNRLWRSRESSGCFRHGAFYYDWRDGFLIVSLDPGYVRAARGAAPLAWPVRLAYDEMHVAWTGDPPGSLILGAATGLRISGSLAWSATPRSQALTLAMAWPEAPLAMAAASNPQELTTAARIAWQHAAPLLEMLQPAWTQALLTRARPVLQRWNLDALPQDWAERADECAVALYGGGTETGTERIAAALVLRAPFRASPPHPLSALLTHGEAKRYQWGGAAGEVQPWLGPEAMLCLADYGPDWLATSHPTLMTKLAGNMADSTGVAADLVIELDWAGLAAWALHLAREAAAYDLLPGLNTRDVQDVLGPPMSVLAELGRLQIAGRARAGELRLRGHLALPSDAQP
jgi:hypothetical protein